MGSHFTNDDLVKETDLAKDYDPIERRVWDAPDPSGASAHWHRIELRPTPHAPVPWDRLVLEAYEVGTAVIPVSTEYYRRAEDANASRTLTYTDVKSIGNRTAPTTLTMTVAAKPGEFTRLVYESLKLDADIPASKFSEQSLRR
jgi:hypothetical protein